jgi:hypothetical protein
LEVFVERIDEHRERQVPLELRRGSREYELAQRIGASRKLGEETGLADPRFAPHLERSRLTVVEPGKRVIDRQELLGTPNELLRKQCHVSSGQG